MVFKVILMFWTTVHFLFDLSGALSMVRGWIYIDMI